jgi:hypothetical protein
LEQQIGTYIACLPNDIGVKKAPSDFIDLIPQCITIISLSDRQEGYFMKTRTANAIFVGIMFAALMGYPAKSNAELNVRIGINVPLPHVVIHAPPAVVVIPGTYAYFAPDAGVDIFFYHGHWYRPHHGHWYRARGYNGPWRNIKHAGVPHELRNLPPDFRRTVRRHERIRYTDFNKNWKTWERNKHWDRRVNRHEVGNVRHGGKIEVNRGRHEVRDVRHGGKIEVNRGRHEVRDVPHGGKKEINQGMREARDDRHDGKGEINHGMRQAQDDRPGGKKEIKLGKHGEKEKFKK